MCMYMSKHMYLCEYSCMCAQLLTQQPVTDALGLQPVHPELTPLAAEKWTRGYCLGKMGM